MILRISKNYRKKPVSESFFLKRNSNSSARVFTMNFAKVLQNTFEQMQFYYSNCSKTYLSFWQQNVCFYFWYLSATLLKRDSDAVDFLWKLWNFCIYNNATGDAVCRWGFFKCSAFPIFFFINNNLSIFKVTYVSLGDFFLKQLYFTQFSSP